MPDTATMTSLLGPPELAPLRDQRHMIGARAHRTIEEVEQAWAAWGLAHGFPARRRFNDFSTDLRVSRQTVTAYVSHGNWTAACPNCNDGIACWSENPRGACLGCGTIYKVTFPASTEIDQAVQALGARPLPNRNWWPGRETAADLRQENIVYGYRPTTPLLEQNVDVLLSVHEKAVESFLEREGELGRRFLRTLGITIGDADPIDEIIDRLTPAAVAGLVALSQTVGG